MIIDLDRIPAAMAVTTARALCHLAVHGTTNQGELAKACGVSRARATHLTDGLEKDGLAMRSRGKDRRKVPVMLTHKGRLVVEGMKPETATATEA